MHIKNQTIICFVQKSNSKGLTMLAPCKAQCVLLGVVLAATVFLSLQEANAQ